MVASSRRFIPSFATAAPWNGLLVLVGYIRFVQRIFVLFLNDKPYDLQINLNGIKAFQAGQALYSWSPNNGVSLFNSFISSPAVPGFLWPFSLVPYTQAVLFYRLLSITVFLLSILILSRANSLRLRSKSLAFGLFWLIALTWEPTFDSIGLGQLNEMILLCLALAYTGWVHNNDWLTGTGIGLAAALKITPILLVLYVLLRGHWRAALIAVMVSGIFAIGSCVGLGNQCLTFATSIFPAISRGSPYYYNQAFNGFWSRLYLPPSSFDWLGLQIAPQIAAVPLLSYLMGAMLIVGVVLAMRNHQQNAPRPLEFGVCLAIILLITPIAWWHYLVWLLVLVSAFFYKGTLFRLEWSTRRNVVVLLLVAVILLNIPPNFLVGGALGLASSSLLLSDGWMSLGLIGVLVLIAGALVIYRSASPLDTATQKVANNL